MIPAPLLVVTDRHGSDRPLAQTVRAALAGGARWIWFRDKDMEPAARTALALELLGLVRAAGGWLTIGGDAELAVEIGADGVHLGAWAIDRAPVHPPHPEVPASAGLEGGLQPALRSLEPSFEAASQHLRMRVEERANVEGCSDGRPSVMASETKQYSPDRRAALPVGVSAHGLDDLRSAAEAGAGYATLSPIFATASKPGYGPALGLAGLREAAGIGLPLLALGGIAPANARACREAGAAGVAVMGAIMRAADPTAATRRLCDALT